jgi:aspartate/methionine/tyrosine aminotransferase
LSFSRRLPWTAESNALSALLEKRRAAGAPILDLTGSNPTLAGLPYSDVLAPLGCERSRRYEPASSGLPEARQAIAEAYGYDAGHVVLTSSTSESYSWLFKLLCDPGDEVLVPRPSYPLFESLASLESVRVSEYPLRYGEGWWIDFDALRAALTARTRAIVVVNPNNPTGSFVKQQEWDQLATVCERSGCVVIADEVFAEFALAGGAGTHAGACPTFTLGGLSKSCGLPQM